MNALKPWLAILAVSSTVGCGQQLVEYGAPDMPMVVDAAPSLDLQMAPDSAQQPDLLMTDLRMSDLLVPDLLVPDLLSRDLLVPDQLRVDLMPDQLMVDMMPDLLPDLMPDLLGSDLGPQNAGPLGTLESYAVLAASTITSTGATTIIGNIGLTPGPMITGIPPGMPINGTIHVNDNAAAQAQMDLTTVYDFMKGKACGTNLSGMDLGGLTLLPGVYCFNIDAGMVIGSTLILDAQGDPNASWTFQIASTLILGDFAKVHVINGGRDCSVYWQVGSSATLGIGSRVAGSILAQASITMTKGASAGRALARTAKVTMDTNDVAVGPCR